MDNQNQNQQQSGIEIPWEILYNQLLSRINNLTAESINLNAAVETYKMAYESVVKEKETLLQEISQLKEANKE